MADLNLAENWDKNEYGTDREVDDFKDFYFSDERLKHETSATLLGPLDVVVTNVATKRGELKLAGKGTKMRAFLTKEFFF